MPETRSGRRTARPRASIPPRLWPTIRTRRPRRATTDSIRDSSCVGGLDGAADVGADVGAVGAVALLAQGAGHQGQAGVAGQEARAPAPPGRGRGPRRARRTAGGARPVAPSRDQASRPASVTTLASRSTAAARGAAYPSGRRKSATLKRGHEDRRYDVLPRSVAALPTDRARLFALRLRIRWVCECRLPRPRGPRDRRRRPSCSRRCRRGWCCATRPSATPTTSRCCW